MFIIDLPTWFLSVLLAPFGLVLGSFGNVLIHRLPQEEDQDRNVVTKPSHCPSCRKPIRWFHNIPLLSWIALGGKCAFCGWRIPFRYPLVELLAGALLAGSVWVLPFGTLIWLKGVLCGYALIVLFFTDLTEFMLPDVIQFPLIALGILFTLPQLWWPGHLTTISTTGFDHLIVETFANGLQPAPSWTLQGPITDWKASLIGAAIGYGVPWAFNEAYKMVRYRDGLGMGDFKMLAWLGAFWGWQAMLMILFAGAFLGVFLGIPMAMAAMATELPRVKRTLRAFGHPTQGAYCARLQRGLMTRMLPFGCALALATPVVVFLGPALWSAYMGLMN